MKPKKTGYQKTLEFLKKYEGFKDTVYLDGNGIPTIGYGFTDPSLIKKGYISRADADKRLEQKVRTIEKELRSKVKGWENLADDSKTALLSYRFNYPAGFKDTTRFMLNWNAGDYSAAIREVDAGMNDENNPGLRERRLAEQALLNADPYLQGAKTQVTDNGKKMTFPRGYWDIPQYESTYQLPKQTNTVYPLNPNDRTVPSLDAWNGADSPSAGPNMPSLLKSMDERKRMFDLFSDNAIALGKKKTLPNLRNVLDRKMEDYIAGIMGVPDIYEEPGYTYTPMMYSPMPVFADGKLPKFEGGKPEDDIIQYTKNGAQYNVNKNVVGAKELSVTTPDVNVVGTDQRPMYQRYDAEHSTYDPNAIKNITELAPGIGDVLQGFDAYDAAKNGLYGQAALLGAGLAIPNVIEKTAKPIVSTIAKKTPTTWIEGAWNAIKKPFEWIGGLFRRKPILMKRHFPEGRNVITHDMLDDDLSNEILKYNSAKSVLYSSTPEYKTSHHDVSNFFMSPLYKERVGRESGYRTWQDVTNRQLDNLSRSTVVDDPKYILYNDSNSPTDWGVYEGALGMNQDGRVTVLPGSAQDIYDHEFLHAANNTTYENPYGVVNRHNAKFQMQPLKPGTGFELEELVQRVRAGMMDMEKRGYDYNNEKDIDRYLNLPMNELPDNIKQLIETYGKKQTKRALYRMYGTAAVAGSAAAAAANDEYPSYKDGKSPIRIKPANRGKLTRLKKRTGKSESELYNDGNPAHKKMVVFARNARKWKH